MTALVQDDIQSSSEEDDLEDEEAEAMPLLDLKGTVDTITAFSARDGMPITAAAASAERKREAYGELPMNIGNDTLRHLWGSGLHANARHLPRVAWLSATLCCIIGSFWLLDSLKDTVFATIVGLEHQPMAKMLSVLTTLVLVLYYNQLLDRIETPKLFYLIGVSYTLLFALIAFLLGNDYIGMANTASHPSRIIGWISYFAIESYGSLAVALFWAFSNATVGMELAECSYGLILAFAQLGAIGGSTLAVRAEVYGVPFIYGIAAVLCSTMIFMILGYVHLFPAYLPKPPSKDAGSNAQSSPGKSICTGLYLVLRYDYMILIFGISCLYEVVLTVLDYEMKIIGRARYDASSAEAAGQFAALMGHFGQATNLLSFIFSLFGFSFVVRRFGLAITLRIFPTLLIIAVVCTFCFPNLWVLFVSMSILKALTYALNEPAKELLYMPTSDAIKFKAKAWIDVFGARSMKALGSSITHAARDRPELLVRYGTGPTMLISIALLAISISVGGRFDELKATGKILGTETSENDSSGARRKLEEVAFEADHLISKESKFDCENTAKTDETEEEKRKQVQNILQPCDAQPSTVDFAPNKTVAKPPFD